MHAYKKALLSVALSFLLPFSAMSADDDGTFTITIQGPEVEDTIPQAQPVQPARRAPARRAAPRQNRQATVNATSTRAPTATATRQPQAVSNATANATSVQQTPARTYTVAQGDTIWSVAHRYLPQDRSVNEFQIVASIYRHNRGAFGQGNVNNLLRTTITIPPVSEIARETTDTGSRLLAQGSMTLPPLGNAPANVNTQATAANTATPAPATPASKPMQSLSDNDIPQYTATETKIKKLQEEEAKKDLSVAMPENTSGADLDKSKATEQTVSNGNNDGNADNNKKAEAAKAMSADLAAAAVDAQSIRIMLDGNKKAIDEKTKVLEQQLAEAMDRMKKTSAATAKTAADSVSTLASQYDNIISGLQQDIIEIKGNISKLSQDNDRMREMLLANDEKIEDMQLQLSQFSVSTPTSVVDLDKPVMMILFGAGLLALVLMIVFLIIKLKSRASAKMTDDFDVEDDYSSDDTLLSDENGSIDLEAPVSGDEDPDTTDTPQREQDKNNNSINSPSDSASDVEAALNEKKQADAEETAPNAAQTPDNSATADNTDTAGADATANEKDPAQEAWDNAATTNSSDESKDDKDVMDEWSKALDEQTGSEKNVDLDKDENKDTSQDDMASAWEAALNEQENAEKKDDDAKSDDEAIADAWSAALNEQKEAEEKSDDKANAPKSEEEAMADAWSAALNEQKEAEEKSDDNANAPKSEEEAMADAWSAALNEQKEAKEKSEDKADAPKSEEEHVAEETSSEKKGEAEDTAPKSEEEAITEAMNKAHENADSAKDSDTPDATTEANDNVDIDSIVDDADKETVSEQENTAETAPSDETGYEEVPATDDIPTDDVKVEDVSEDELLNHLKDNSDKILEENHVDPESLDTKAEPSQVEAETSDNVDTSDVVEDLDDSNKTEDITEPSKEDNSSNEEAVPSEDPKEQLSGEEKAFLESMSDSKNSDSAEDENAQTEPEFKNSDSKEDNIPDVEAEVVSDDEVPQNNSVGSNVDEVLNDDLNLEDLLNGNDNVVDAPEESESPEEKADGVETFDSVPEDEEKQNSEHTIDEEADPDTDTVEAENTETVDVKPVDTDESDKLDTEAVEPEFAEPEQVDSFGETPVEEAQITPSDEETAETSEDADTEEDDTNDIGDIQNKSEQVIFNPESQDDNSKDENGVVSWAVPDDDFDIVGKGKETNATVAPETVEYTPQNEDTLPDTLEDTKDKADVAADTNDDAHESKESEIPFEKVEASESDAEDAKALDDLEQRLSASKAQYDTGADEDIMNMLSGGVHDDLPHDNEKAFTDDEIASMMSSANAVDPKSIPEDDLALDEPVEDKSSEPDEVEDHSLENVADTIGPISSQSDDDADDNNLDNAENTDDYEGLNAKQHQYYVDELNLARLYFETGDTEEALKIIDDVKEHGSSDLKEEASKIIETYGN